MPREAAGSQNEKPLGRWAADAFLASRGAPGRVEPRPVPDRASAQVGAGGRGVG
jgi:hypothetical protein